MLINQNKKVHIDIGPKMVTMYECTGKVHSVFSYVNKYKNLLDDSELVFIERSLTLLQTVGPIPDYLNKCLARTDDLKLHDDTFTFYRSGARSAYWKEEKIKFKGCRPLVSKPASFPMEKLKFGTNSIEYGSIPFGVLTKEAVMREILAYCFFKDNSLHLAHTPLCVYEYLQNKTSIGCCLVLDSLDEARIEQFIDYPELSINELMQIKSHNSNSKYLIGSELPLHGVNVNKYSDSKAKLLSEMHFGGGFRGILNSNIGNDIILEKGNRKLLICDFDTFKVIPIPDQPNLEFLQAFILHCVIEVIKGSISILDYVQFKEGLSVEDQNRILFQKYIKISSLWRAYERHFRRKVKESQWDEHIVKQAFSNILKTSALFKILSLVIPNNTTIDHIIDNRNTFYSHN